MITGEPGLLDAGSATFLQGRVSVLVGSRDALLRPHLVRGVGVRISEGGCALRLLVGRRQSAAVLRDLQAFGPVAAVFSEPTTHRTLQFKARTARVSDADDEDRRCAERYVGLFSTELAQLGFRIEMTQALLSGAEDLVAITFVPEEAFDQTPGPQAGAPLRQ